MDLAAKQSLLLPTITDPCPSPAYDLKSYYRSLILSSWHDHWSSLPSNKLHSIKKSPIPWSSLNRPTRREEVVLTRLRIGHIRLTHSFLYLGLFAPPSCSYCGEEDLSVQHFFSCPALEIIRLHHAISLSLTINLSNNHDTITNTLNYLRSAPHTSSTIYNLQLP